MKQIKNLFGLLACSLGLLLVTSCNDNNKGQTPDNPEITVDRSQIGHDITTAGGYEAKDGLPFFIGYAVGYNQNKQSYYLTYAEKIDDPSITINGGGSTSFPLVSDERAPHAYRSSDGYIYSLTYRVGDITSVQYNKSTKKFQFDRTVRSQNVIGNSNMRFTLLNNTHYSSVHEVSKKLEGGAVKATYNIAILDHNTFTLSLNHSGEIVLPNGQDKQGYFIGRIHSPVITGGKIYYGAQITKTDVSNPKDRGKSTDITATLIFDYPSFKNPQVITYKENLGSTTGYRSRNMFLAEDGKTIYQLTGWAGGKVHMLKIRDGKYLDGTIDIAGKCGHSKSKSFGWFYAGKGIAFVPYAKGDADPLTITKDPEGKDTQENPWGIARVDLNTGDVLDLEVPGYAFLTQYQEAAIRNGKIYFAITPVGNHLDKYEGNVYIWDVENTKKAPKVGAKLINGTNNLYSAIF